MSEQTIEAPARKTPVRRKKSTSQVMKWMAESLSKTAIESASESSRAASDQNMRFIPIANEVDPATGEIRTMGCYVIKDLTAEQEKAKAEIESAAQEGDQSWVRTTDRQRG